MTCGMCAEDEIDDGPPRSWYKIEVPRGKRWIVSPGANRQPRYQMDSVRGDPLDEGVLRVILSKCPGLETRRTRTLLALARYTRLRALHASEVNAIREASRVYGVSPRTLAELARTYRRPLVEVMGWVVESWRRVSSRREPLGTQRR